jgi:S-adenosylmethionine hydrolase
MPVDSVYLAVVDPGVGTARKDVAVETSSGAMLVGPDNGVLSLAWAGLGGATGAVIVESERVVLPSVSTTFHARDVLAPAAAHLAGGAALGDLGSPIDPGTLVVVAVPEPEVHAGRIQAEVLGIDRFGNVQLTARERDLDDAGLGQALWLMVRTVWQSLPMERTSTFGDVPSGEFALVVDSQGRLAVIKNGGSAARSMRVGLGEPVVIEPAGR